MARSPPASFPSSTSAICEYMIAFILDLFSYKRTHRNHASNAYMLHALGITHVVSVGECALVPPLSGEEGCVSPEYQVVLGRQCDMPGSLWREEREGRIKVLDIKVRSPPPGLEGCGRRSLLVDSHAVVYIRAYAMTVSTVSVRHLSPSATGSIRRV